MRQYYVYHAVPEIVEGKHLYPLNQLKDKYPEIYKKSLGKYSGREWVLEAKIERLDCTFKDILNLTPVCPVKLKLSWVNLFSSKLSFPFSHFYRFSAEDIGLNEMNSCFFIEKKERVNGINKNLVEYFSKESLGKYNEINRDTIRYYKKCLRDNRTPLVFAHVPHVLFKGAIPLFKGEIVKV